MATRMSSSLSKELLEKAAESRFFSGLPAEDVAEIFKDAVQLRVTDLETAVVPDTPIERIFVIVEGHIGILNANKKAGNVGQLVDIMGPGEVIGLPEVLAGNVLSFTVTAFDKATVIAVSGQALIAVLSRDTDKTLSLIGGLSLRMRSLVRQVTELKSLSATQRVASYLLSLALESLDKDSFAPGDGPYTFSLPFNKKIIASHLAMKPESFSRSVAKLADIGITTRGSSVTIDNPAQLSEMIEHAG